MTTPSASAFLSAPTTQSLSGNNIFVDVYINSGQAQVLDSLTEHVPIGLLPAGSYNYRVTLHPPIDIPFGRDQRIVTGLFQVVPEPSALGLGLVAVSVVLRARRRSH